MRGVTVVLCVVAAASSAMAAPTQVFPLSAPNLPDARRGMPERLTQAIVDELEAELSSVPIEDAASLLECDIDEPACLEAVSRSVGDKQLVFGTIVSTGGTLAVTLTRFRPGRDPQRQTYELTGEREALPDELVRKSAPLFGRAAAPAPVPDEPAPLPPPVETPRRGTISTGTWALLGAGLVATGVGIGFRVSASGIAEDVRTAPRETPADFARLTSLEDKGRLHTWLGGALVVGGGVALLAGAVRAYVQLSSPPRGEGRSVGVVPLTGGAAVTITWGMR